MSLLLLFGTAAPIPAWTYGLDDSPSLAYGLDGGWTYALDDTATFTYSLDD